MKKPTFTATSAARVTPSQVERLSIGELVDLAHYNTIRPETSRELAHQLSKSSVGTLDDARAILDFVWLGMGTYPDPYANERKLAMLQAIEFFAKMDTKAHSPSVEFAKAVR